MLGYQHEYHAGNHADVLKHAVLSLCVEALQRKDTPIRVIDAHAGSGVYDLGSREARRHAEFESGVRRVLAAASPPEEIAPYLAAVRALSPGKSVRYYPGSPALARGMLRPGDHLELMELHPRAVSALRRQFGRDSFVHIHQRDCFEGLPALVPPPERRGLALIDPAYEVKNDFRRVVDLLVASHGRWPGGIYLVWYPLIRDRDAERFSGKIAASGIRRIFRVALQVEANDFTGLRGSGLMIVNLPYGLNARLEVLMPWLWKAMSVAGAGDWHSGWLVPE